MYGDVYMIKFIHKGDFRKTKKFLKKCEHLPFEQILEKYGNQGRDALAANTPKDTGNTASQWGYEIEKSHSGFKITWTNSNINKGVPIAIILQYGHGTGSGGYVEGQDYINPALKPIFDKIAEEAWEEVKNA